MGNGEIRESGHLGKNDREAEKTGEKGKEAKKEKVEGVERWRVRGKETDGDA